MPQTNLSKGQELNSDPLIKYSEEVREILNDLYLFTLRQPISEERLEDTIKSWMEHFIEERIPLNRLREVYNVALRSCKPNEYFSGSTMISAWQIIQLTDLQTNKESCSICQGRKKVKVFNFEKGWDEEVPCKCSTFDG